MAAPVTVIVAYDPRFYDKLPRLYPASGCQVLVRRQRVAGRGDRIPQRHAAGRLPDTGGARAGAGCRADVGLRQAKVDEAFLSHLGWKSNFLVNLGHGDPAGLHPRNPRAGLRRGLPPRIKHALGSPQPMTRLRIATWNINSLRLRLPLLKELVASLDPDVICLQETKVPDALFPAEGPASLGFPFVAHRGMKGYNGVAILSRVPFEVQDIAPDWCERAIAGIFPCCWT